MNRQHILAQLLLCCWPFPRGAGAIIDRYFSNTSFDEEVVTVPTTDAFDISIFPNELLGRHIYLTGEFDRTIVEVLCNFSKEGDTLLDIGANVGYVSTCFLKNVPGSRVISVEPQKRVLDLLKTNLARFPRDRYEVLPFALSDRDGETFFELNKANSGTGRIVSEESPNTTEVEVRTADGLFLSGRFDNINLVKIDVEGHEEQVFQSCQNTINKLRPRAIVFEEHGSKAALSGPIGSILNKIGYRVYGIRKFLTKVVLVRVCAESDCTFNDYIAISQREEIPPKARLLYGNSFV